MAARFQKTLADYLVIAISPALIMALVGSLVFFLLEVSYHGEFATRMRWILFWFVFASVLIARIGIEQGRDQARMYGLGLGVATGLVMLRLVDNVLIAWGLLGLVWWCANKLTWDCTLIDDSQDASGQGLLEAAAHRDLPAPQASDDSPELGAQPRKPQAPGVWVVYFSLAALPLFGLGQLMIPADQTAARSDAFRLLWMYVAAALGLLLTTSFLGLRRYLRQRRLQMPPSIAGGWIATGSALIVFILIACLFLPRPDAAYSVTSVGGLVESVVRDASRFALLRSNAAKGEGRRIGESKDKPAGPPEQRAGEAGGGKGAGEPGGGDAEKSNDSQQPHDGSGGRSQSQTKGDASQQPSQQSSGQSDASDSRQPPSQGSAPDSSSSNQSESSSPKGDTSSPKGDASSDKNGSSSRNSESSSDKSGSASDRAGDQQSKTSPANSQPSPDSGSSGQPESATQGQPKGEAAKRDPPGDSENAPPRGNANENPPPAERQGQNQQPDQQANQRPNQQPDQQQNQQPNQPAAEKNAAAKPADKASPPPASPPGSPPTGLADWLGRLAKWVFYGVLVAVILWLVIRHWEQLSAMLGQLWAALLSLFSGFSSRKKHSAGDDSPAPSPPARRPAPFADFQSPFATGRADRMPAEEVVQYTFDALQAWAYERDLGRVPEQTPLEFSRVLCERVPGFSREIDEAAQLYARAAYSGRATSRTSLPALEKLWRRMSE